MSLVPHQILPHSEIPLGKQFLLKFVFADVDCFSNKIDGVVIDETVAFQKRFLNASFTQYRARAPINDTPRS